MMKRAVTCMEVLYTAFVLLEPQAGRSDSSFRRLSSALSKVVDSRVRAVDSEWRIVSLHIEPGGVGGHKPTSDCPMDMSC